MSKFLENLRNKAKALTKKIAFDEIDDERILKAIEKINDDKIAIPVIVGNKEKLKSKSEEFGVNLDGLEVFDPADSEYFDELANSLYELRKAKGLELDQAKEMIKDPIYFATMLLKTGKIDGIVSGASHATSHVLKPALQIIKTKPGLKTASSYFLLVKDDENLIFSDCGMNIDPNKEQLADIAITSYDTAKFLGLNEPKVAMLSFSTKGSAQHPFIDKVVEATEIVKANRTDIPIEGELQFDAAYIESVAQKKCPDSKVAGKANIFIFPDLNSGNIGYKIAQRMGGYQAIGPLVQGLNLPVNDLSRGCNVDDIVDLCAITVLNTE